MPPVTELAIRLRPATADDLPFARGLYFETMRWIIERHFGWDEQAEIGKFDRQFVPGEVQVVLRGEQAVGWLQVEELGDHLFLKQMYVRPQDQRRGIGTGLLATVFDRARSLGKPVRLGVVKFNPARRLYERTGFRVISEDQYKFYMERPAD
jgi:GNAT superfamily N-acetyltransferase